MWPFYLLFNKTLKLEEPRESGEDDLSFVELYPFEKFPSRIKCDAPILSRSQVIEVPHINQQQQWDCGLACVLMVLNTVGVNDCHIQSLADLCCTTSIWTVDLAYLLQTFSVSFSYFTVTFGANPNYSVESFYKEELANDLVRVDRLFQKALEAGIKIERRSISREEISLLMLSGIYVAIVLVDQHRLSRSWLEDVLVSGICDSNFSYTGHYIVVCGYDADADEFEIRDPASTSKRDRISSKCLDDARKCFGTDEDILLVSLQKSRKQKTPSPHEHVSPNVNINC
ncbi:protein GUCD1 [Momordica charantia]|uniref:Protein GUCD1 n=1 Tax=Momordica charantia TaxID=3673 RepID=A0A6J1BWP9_MOMCH|nr:protein GUCD1 [Momordica charantia]XP_022133979.1 protein GUCD1 [Momordica charantia]XP_022133980.1 protein GUCD1 [Momordica charantia]XP_022133981.1 protein GUCD1 [Momordica charantia]XP_022133982.1 protein GUCD1 [Momordica charantia]XP_022133984.1 protein GUCD1 [Momordica charantia]XP_022133985.1 protein GUCD1 [Momordica charantia]XP_022133986.1 protein GUCD1 [Momordica charantia]XP_022133987.1 protein GUCD1 [Momordica charantia]XP_022133988.1 protein GUCD1 [Momordica charantia]XP_02